MLGAFIAGNVKAQITNGIRSEHPYEGILQIIATYKQLVKANATEEIPSIGKWIELQESGKLKAVIKKQSNKRIDDVE